MPERIQMRRTAGWRKPEGVIYVGRPSKWGNPFVVKRVAWFGEWWVEDPNSSGLLFSGAGPNAQYYAATVAVLHYREVVVPGLNLRPLAGHDLGCWCRLDQPCHADVLLELANS